ncbi:synaptophysin-like protein 2 [Protopterus annectens]|uniref:synaptophysin-like protein 2 n=1 Tax=Protopterus annectens TaxID=7888 RepID=UPI001CFB9A35|nr:synaptophysin-like protein 2 [Protopterus annectens]
MEQAPQQPSGFTPNLKILKEPLGFIKVLEWIFAIFAFGTCGGYSGNIEATIKCNDEKNVTTLSIPFGYPFRLNRIFVEVPSCGNQSSEKVILSNDYSAYPEFFVTLGAFAFLYCMGALIVYLGYRHVYLENKKLPVLDFIFTFLFAFFWLVASSAWGKGLTDIKNAVSTENVFKNFSICLKASVCRIGELTAWGRLNVSVIFGFLNLIIWGGNCWFVFKETHWHKKGEDQNRDPGEAETDRK